VSFGAADLRRVLGAYAAALAGAEDEINDLNVFPVPDGDTGTNMRLTVEGVLDAIGPVDDGADLYPAVRRAALMAARGTSGIILSQWLRGFCEVVAEREPAGPGDVAEALAAASTAARAAVTNPVEGTILTVAEGAAAAAAGAAGQDMVSLWRAVASGAAQALARTPELLDVLRRAGVVDAGGRGLSLLFDVAAGAEPSLPVAVEHRRPAQTRRHSRNASDWTEVTLLVDTEDIEQLRRRWSEIGSSIVVSSADEGGPWRCHVHTTDVDAAVAVARSLGTTTGVRTEVLPGPDVHVAAAAPAAGTAVVAVANGEGMVRAMAELGAVVVSGGETMNPSTEELLDAVVATGARGVVILPNDKDVVGVARAAAALADLEVAVVPTRTMAAGVAALGGHDPSLGVDADAASMAAEPVSGTGSVSRAVRDAETPIGLVRKGQWLGFVDGTPAVAGSDPVDVGCEVLVRCGAGAAGTLVVFTGAEADPATTEALAGEMARRWPAAAVAVEEGGQPFDVWLVAVRFSPA